MRRLAIWLAVLVAGVGALALAWSDLVEAGLTLALRRAGFADARVTVVRAGVDWTRAEVDLGAGRRLGTVTVLHPWRDLLDGRVARVVVAGADLGIDVDARGEVRVAGLALPAAADDADADGADDDWPVLPVALTVQDSTLRVTWPAGAVTLPLSLAVDAGASPAVRVAVGAQALGQDLAQDLGLALELDGRLEPGRRFAATVSAHADDLSRLGGPAGRLAASGAVSGHLGREAVHLDLDGCLAVRADGLVLAGTRVEVPEGACLAGAEDGPAAVVPLDGGVPVLRVTSRVPRLAVPDAGLRVEDLDLATAVADGRLVADATAGRVLGAARPEPFAPFAITGHAEGPLDGDIALTVRADGPAGVRVRASGRHGLASGEGRLDARLDPVVFRPDGLQPSALSPLAGAMAEAVAGTVAARGTLAWGAKGLDTSGRLLLTDVAATAGPVSVAGVNGVVGLSSLMPPVVPAGQVLAVQRLDVGLPLTDGVLRFGLDRRGVVAVDEAEWHWAGGTVRARPFRLALAAPEGRIELEAAGLDLGAVLDLVTVEGLAATGRLDGVMPLWVEGETVRIDGAALSARDGGTLRYDPAEPPSFLTDGEPGSPTALLMGALTDFRYDSLGMTINGVAGGELVVGLSIRGSNPEFYDGYPVALNLNVSGALDRILRQSLDAYRIPDAVRDRMLEFQQ